MYTIRTLNAIADEGLSLFDPARYAVADDCDAPDAILVRSADMRGLPLHPATLAVARAGAGVNNIPLERCGEAGVVVFNTPGANANAVKELALAAILLSSRNILGAVAWAKTLPPDGDIAGLVERRKAAFAGPEILGKTLGVVGLGAIGVMVANAAAALGMNVSGYDPYISVDAAWKLSDAVRKAESLESLLAASDYVTIHIPYDKAGGAFFNAERLALMKRGGRLINLARGELADEDAVVAALDDGRLSLYATDFPSARLLSHPAALCTPHLGASTPEAERNCARMACRQLVDFLETGAIKNAVNFPRCAAAPPLHHRLAVINRNIPNMVGQITAAIARGGINITDLLNHHQGGYAYTLIDTESPLPPVALETIRRVAGVIRARVIEKPPARP